MSNEDTKQEALAVVEDAREAAAKIESIQVTDKGSYEMSGEILRDLKGQAKEIKARQDAALNPLKAAMAEIKGWFKPALDYLAESETHLKGQLTGYLADVDAQQNKLLAEGAQGTTEQARDAIVKAAEMAPPKMEGISIRETWTFEVIDVDAIPDEFKIVDQKALAAVVRAQKSDARIPGIRVFKKSTMAVKS